MQLPYSGIHPRSFVNHSVFSSLDETGRRWMARRVGPGVPEKGAFQFLLTAYNGPPYGQARRGEHAGGATLLSQLSLHRR